jgi:RNA polymerase sigma factor (TIGR02999 family)
MADPQTVTVLLQRWRQGDEEALASLAPMVYRELRRIAARYLRREAANHTWQPTDLVHEAYLQLAGADIDWQDRAHFLAVAAQQMRRLLVDHARGKRRAKRGAGIHAITLDEDLLPTQTPVDNLLDLDGALNRLAVKDSRKAAILELHVFGGLTYEETARVLDLSPATVSRELRFAKAWVYNEIQVQRTGPQ